MIPQFVGLLHLLALLTPSALWAAPAPYRAQSWQDISKNGLPIRVRLSEGSSVVTLRGFDLQIRQGIAHQLTHTVDPARALEFRCQEGRIRATPIDAETKNETQDLQEPVSIRAQSGFVHFKNRPYREEIRIYSVGSLCEVVNNVELEDYLDGLVNAEFSSRWSEEAVSAQVVAARTYALYQIRWAREKNPSQHYDVDASVNDQVYDGSFREDHLASRLVDRSRGMVLLSPVKNPKLPYRFEPIKAFYHSTCGGHTELPQNVWGQNYLGFNRPVQCTFCKRSPAYQWELELSSSEISNALKLRASSHEGNPMAVFRWPRIWKTILSQGKLISVVSEAQQSLGRNSQIKTEWEWKGQKYCLKLPAAKFRDWLGNARIKSTAFNVDLQPNGSWYFQGRGNGHGVGMCQWGAKTMGERGYKMASILKHYYPDAILRKLW